jgi:hypothetical protein
MDMHRVVKNLNHLTHPFPAEINKAIFFLLSGLIVLTNVLFLVYLMLPSVLCFWLVVLIDKINPKLGGEMLSCVSNLKKTEIMSFAGNWVELEIMF